MDSESVRRMFFNEKLYFASDGDFSRDGSTLRYYGPVDNTVVLPVNYKDKIITSYESMFGWRTDCADMLRVIADATYVHSTYAMFIGCTKAKHIALINIGRSSAVSTAHSMFMCCSSVEHIILRGLDSVVIPQEPYALHGCISLQRLDV